MSRQLMDVFNESAPYPPQASGTPFETLPLLDNQTSHPQVEEVKSGLEKIRYQFQEWAKSLNLRLEKVNQRFASMEDRMKQVSKEFHEQFNFLSSRIQDRRGSDLKVEALIERHNRIVQSFELRLSQSQRLIENQSLQLAKQQELIDDARRQIERLKKL